MTAARRIALSAIVALCLWPMAVHLVEKAARNAAATVAQAERIAR